MNRRNLARAGGSLALIVLSTTTAATDCEQMNEQRVQESQSRSESQVVIRADREACWRVTVNGRNHTGCGDTTIYVRRNGDRYREARVEKVDGEGSVRVTLVVQGRTVDRDTVRECGEHVLVKQKAEHDDWE